MHIKSKCMKKHWKKQQLLNTFKTLIWFNNQYQSMAQGRFFFHFLRLIHKNTSIRSSKSEINVTEEGGRMEKYVKDYTGKAINVFLVCVTDLNQNMKNSFHAAKRSSVEWSHALNVLMHKTACKRNLSSCHKVDGLITMKHNAFYGMIQQINK